MTLQQQANRPNSWPNRTGLTGMRPLHLITMALLSMAAVACVLVRLRAGPDSWTALPLAVATGPLALIDLRHRRLPNWWLAPTAMLTVVLGAGLAMVERDWLRPGNAGLIAALAGVAALLAATRPSAPLGMGDAKLIALIAGVLGMRGWQVAVAGLSAGALIAGAVAVILVACGRAGRRDVIACGPWLLAGAWLLMAMPP